MDTKQLHAGNSGTNTCQMATYRRTHDRYLGHKHQQRQEVGSTVVCLHWVRSLSGNIRYGPSSCIHLLTDALPLKGHLAMSHLPSPLLNGCSMGGRMLKSYWNPLNCVESPLMLTVGRLLNQNLTPNQLCAMSSTYCFLGCIKQKEDAKVDVTYPTRMTCALEIAWFRFRTRRFTRF